MLDVPCRIQLFSELLCLRIDLRRCLPRMFPFLHLVGQLQQSRERGEREHEQWVQLYLPQLVERERMSRVRAQVLDQRGRRLW
jgi:hypothetical protein